MICLDQDFKIIILEMAAVASAAPERHNVNLSQRGRQVCTRSEMGDEVKCAYHTSVRTILG